MHPTCSGIVYKFDCDICRFLKSFSLGIGLLYVDIIKINCHCEVRLYVNEVNGNLSL